MTLQEALAFVQEITDGIDENAIQSITIEPTQVIVALFELDENGSKSIRANGSVATDFKVYKPETVGA